MKITFEFNLPDDQDEYDVVNQANKMQSLLWDFAQQLRSWRKYGSTFKDANDALEQITKDFYELVNTHGVYIDL
jgi:hypothetical protein